MKVSQDEFLFKHLSSIVYIRKMSEQNKQETCIKCKCCKCKCINDDEHIKQDFGYNRLVDKFKTCVKCRNINTNNKGKPKLQSIDTNVNTLYSACLQVKPKSDFGNLKHVRDVENINNIIMIQIRREHSLHNKTARNCNKLSTTK